MLKRTKYNPTWESEFDWLKPSKMSEYFALCIFCKQYFEVGSSGKPQVVRHSKSQKHILVEKSRRKNSSLPPISASNNKIDSSTFKPNKEEEMISAEIIWTLRSIDSGYSFSGCSSCSAVFKSMFPDSSIAKSVDLNRAKIKHLAQFGILPYIEKIVKSDMQGSPFSLILDETIISSLKKQFDVYIQYWSSTDNALVSAVYCGSIYVGNYRTENLKTNFFELLRRMGLDCCLMLQISMLGPNPNLKFLKTLAKELDELYFTSLLDIGIFSVHPVCAGLRKGLSYINFAYEEFLGDLIFFFKASSLKKEDDKCLQAVAAALSNFFVSQDSSKWLFLKLALYKILEQYRNIKEYFLAFLPKQENFKREVENSNKYKCISKILKDKRTLIYINFVISATNMFEPTIINFLRCEPFIHLLYDDLTKLLFELMSHFLKQNVIIKHGKRLDGDKLLQIDCRNKNLYLHNVTVSVSIKREISQSSLNAKAVAEVQEDFLQFFVESTSYLQKKLPLNSQFLKDVTHVYSPQKDTEPIIRACKTIISLIRNENVLNRLFHTQGKDKNSLLEMIANQAKAYAYEKGSPHDSMEDQWKQAEKLKSNFCEKNYPQLQVMAKCLMVLNHGHVTSISNKISDPQSLDEDSMHTIKFIKGYLLRIGGIENFIINREVIKAVKNSHKRYVEYMDRKNRKRKG